MKLPFCRSDMVNFMERTFMYAQRSPEGKGRNRKQRLPVGCGGVLIGGQGGRQTPQLYNSGALNHRNM